MVPMGGRYPPDRVAVQVADSPTLSVDEVHVIMTLGVPFAMTSFRVPELGELLESPP
jgi:hypothetical protein